MPVRVPSDHGSNQRQAVGQRLEELPMNHAASQGLYDQAPGESPAAGYARLLWRRMPLIERDQSNSRQPP